MDQAFDFEEVAPDKWESYHIGKELYALIIYSEPDRLWGFAVYDGLKALKSSLSVDDALIYGKYFTRFSCARACNDFLNTYRRNS